MRYAAAVLEQSQWPQCPRCAPHAWHGLPCGKPYQAHVGAQWVTCTCPGSHAAA